MGFMAISMFDKRPEAFGVIDGFGIRPKADFGKRTWKGSRRCMHGKHGIDQGTDMILLFI